MWRPEPTPRRPGIVCAAGNVSSFGQKGLMYSLTFEDAKFTKQKR